MSGAEPRAPRARAERHDFLVELGTEELPPKALTALEQALVDGIRTRLIQAGLRHGPVESFATPRRLAVRVQRLVARQSDQVVKRRGPPVSAAFDGAGQPTRAAQAFAQSCGSGLEQLGRERDAKGNEYLVFSGTRPGATTVSLLPGMVQEALDALPIPRRMRWGAGEAQFVRPVHWLLMLFGRQVVPARVLDTEAGDRTWGHRFMSSKPLRIVAPASYAATLARRGYVLPQFAARRERIREQVTAAAQTLGGRALMGEALLDEVTALVEWPVAVAGRFEDRFLALPREVLISTLQDHQRYFAVEDSGGGLLAWFITVSNIDSPQPDVVRAGNERVVRPRLSDAAFFWEQDHKRALAARLPELDGVTFQAQLGSQGERVQRITAVASAVAAALGADEPTARRAAQLCKCDLLTAMVGEFPELQGIMGAYYALADGEPEAVAVAIREHYQPRSAADELPGTAVGATVALADKLDLLAGVFAIGQKPSGTKDPFGLRRAAIGALRILMGRSVELDLHAVLRVAVAAQPLADLAPRVDAVAAEIYDYVVERLRAQYLESAAVRDSTAVTTEMFDAVLALRPSSIVEFDARLKALAGFIARPESQSLAAANKRIANILRKSEPVSGAAVAAGALGAVNSALLREPAEAELHQALSALTDRVGERVAARDYAGALDTLAGLRGQVDAFFDRVLVNDPDAALRANRLALLGALRALFMRVADFSRLPG
jgi:glycyl-tRNA synthetase beta chain